MSDPIVTVRVPLPYPLYQRLRERGEIGEAIVRILEEVLAEKPAPLPDADHCG